MIKYINCNEFFLRLDVLGIQYPRPGGVFFWLIEVNCNEFFLRLDVLRKYAVEGIDE
jgi:hypothetical protein